MGIASLVWNICTEHTLQKSDWRDAYDVALALPTLLLLWGRDCSESKWLRRWLGLLAVIYAINVATDAFSLISGRWSKAAARSLKAVTDAGSLYMWAQILYIDHRIRIACQPQHAP